MASTYSDISSPLPHAPSRTVSILLAGSLLVGLTLRIYWAFLLPYNDAPDEYCHWPMVKYLAEHGRPPTMADVPDTIPVSYSALCPVGYVPMAIIVSIFGADHPHAYLAARVTGAVLGTLSVLFLYWATRWLLTDERSAVLVAWLAALHPQLVFTSAAINNDSAMLLATSICWWLWMRLGRNAGTLATFVLLGAVSGLAFLCKPNGVGILAAGIPILLHGMKPSKDSPFRSAVLLNSGVALVTGLLVVAPWIAWSYSRTGSLFGFEIHRDWWIHHIAERGIRQGFLTWELLPAFLHDTWDASFGSFGYASVELTEFDYSLVTLLFGWAGGATLAARRSVPIPRHLVMALLFGVLAVWGSHIYHSVFFGLAAQGRYVLAAVWPFLVLLVVGAEAMVPRLGSIFPRLVLVVVFAWLQNSAIDVERRSNRIDQPDRRIRARLIGYVTDLPGRLAEPLDTLVPVGVTELRPHGDRRLLVTKEGGAVRWPVAIPVHELGGVVVEQQWMGEPVNEGKLRLIDAEHDEAILAEIPYRDPQVGMVRYRFDLRSLAKTLKPGSVFIEFQPSTSAAVVILRQLKILGADWKRLSPPPQNKETGPVGSREQ